VLRLIAEFRQSEFRPEDFELETGNSDDVSPLTIHTVDGKDIVISGTVDRVDLCEIKGKRFVRVIDYKSGTKKFSLSDVYYGLNLQMALYLFMLWKNGKNKYKDVFPAGILYMPAGDSTPNLPRDASEEKMVDEKISQYKMSGIVLEDPEVVSAMEKNVSGIYIPVKRKKDGDFDARSALINLEELGILERYVERLVLRMTASLQDGDIQAVPSYTVNGKVTGVHLRLPAI